MLTEGAEVTIPSQDVDTVVTEYGIASLKGLSIKDRMQALIRIAHPDFRDWIREEANRLGIDYNTYCRRLQRKVKQFRSFLKDIGYLEG